MSIMFERISLLCEKNRLKIAQLETTLGFSERSIAKWEKSGDNAWISRVQAIADFFDVSLDYLVGNTNNPQSHKEAGVLKAQETEFVESLKQLSSIALQVVNFLDSH